MDELINKIKLLLLRMRYKPLFTLTEPIKHQNLVYTYKVNIL